MHRWQAIAIATANRVLMLEHAVYSVISPEGCASILWKSADKKELAAEAMGMSLPGSAAPPSVDRRRDGFAKASGEYRFPST